MLAVSDWPSTRDCFFGYPGSRVFVVVGAERRGNTWHGGTYSEPVTWPDCSLEPDLCGEEPDDDGEEPDDDGQAREVRISWGSDASDREDCPQGTRCRNLNYEFIGDWDPPNYTVECRHDGRRVAGPFVWSGRPQTSCFYWTGTAEVIIDGIRSNAITFAEHDGQAREVRISWGSDASDREDCPQGTRCRNLNYEFIGDWDPPNYTVECRHDGRRVAGPFVWSGRPQTSCFYWTGTAHVIIDGIRSNTITFAE